MGSTPENMLKYENYKEQMKRLKAAMTNHFYLEAVFIEYAILEDRLESALRHSGKWHPKPDQHTSIDRKVRLLMAQAEEHKSPAQKYFQPEMMQEVLDWKNKRNPLMHSLMKQQLHTDDLASFAEDGMRLVKQVGNKVKLFNRATEQMLPSIGILPCKPGL